jgi:hypothetical protein
VTSGATATPVLAMWIATSRTASVPVLNGTASSRMDRNLISHGSKEPTLA